MPMLLSGEPLIIISAFQLAMTLQALGAKLGSAWRSQEKLADDWQLHR